MGSASVPYLRWRLQKMTLNGSGWVAVGIGEEQSDSMKGADMIVLQKTGSEIVAEDRFAVDFVYPIKDDQQDVELISATEIDGILQAVVRRPLVTCDSQDTAVRLHYPHRLPERYK